MELSKIKQIAKQALDAGKYVEVLAKGSHKTKIVALVDSMDDKFLHLKSGEHTQNFLSKIRFILVESVKIHVPENMDNK